MFGFDCAFTRSGQMFTGLHEERMIVRLPEKGRLELMQKGGRPFEPMPGRTMKEYVVLPASLLADASSLRSWVLRALEYAASLPAKVKGQKAKPAARSSPARLPGKKIADKKKVPGKGAGKKAPAKKKTVKKKTVKKTKPRATPKKKVPKRKTTSGKKGKR